MMISGSVPVLGSGAQESQTQRRASRSQASTGYTCSGPRPTMLRIVLFTCGGFIALYLVWNIIQFFYGNYKDRQAAKTKKGNRPMN
jgi:hypothetical protein